MRRGLQAGCGPRLVIEAGKPIAQVARKLGVTLADNRGHRFASILCRGCDVSMVTVVCADKGWF